MIVQAAMPAAKKRVMKPTIVKILWIFDSRLAGLTMRAMVATMRERTPMPPKMNGDSSINSPILLTV